MEKDSIRFIKNDNISREKSPLFLNVKNTESVRRFHESVEGYEPTPLIKLDCLSEKLGVKGIYVKDESFRFGLKAFKGLGGIYALFQVICEKLSIDAHITKFSDLKKAEWREQISDMIFVTATDGNHGKGIAWAADQLGCRSYVYMPKGSSGNRAQAIRKAGKAEVTITDMDYDDTVRYAEKMSETHGWILVQDTSWPGYEKVPSWIIQGYTTMAFEAVKQLEQYGVLTPTHVFLQCGVGAMAGGVTGFLADYYNGQRPNIYTVEPNQVACIYESARVHDGSPHKATGNGNTIMAGLNCGEPCTITWPILRDFAAGYLTCSDCGASRAMKQLAYPIGTDRHITAGESGAATMGLLLMVLLLPELKEMKEQLKLDENSEILLFNTEGDTDEESYEKIIRMF